MSISVIPDVFVTERTEGKIALERDALIWVSEELREVASRFAEDTAIESGMDFRVSTDEGKIRVELSDADLDILPPTSGVRADGSLEADERHGVEISSAQIRVWGPTPEAVFRGLTTLRQLIAAGSGASQITLPVLRILDAPRFAWRGLSLDVVRRFHSADEVKRVIDMCALYKINVLHLHLTDDQGWRIPVDGRAALTHGSEAYTPAEVADLVSYAAARFITVVPEVDIPGHSAAALIAVPTLGAPQVEGTMPTTTLDINNDDTWPFVTDVLSSLTHRFPGTAYLHIGGDEAFGMADDDHAEFVTTAAVLVRDLGRSAVVWQEGARGELGTGDLVQYWIHPDEAIGVTESETMRAFVTSEMLEFLAHILRKSLGDIPRAIERGSQILVSVATRLYFDRPHASPSLDPAQEEQRHSVGLQIYPAASLRDYLEWDPIEETPGVVSDEQLAGVEAAVWCETVRDSIDLEFLLLPRLPGAAERAWSRAGASDWAAYSPRLAAQPHIWDARGWYWFRSSEVPDWHLTHHQAAL